MVIDMIKKEWRIESLDFQLFEKYTNGKIKSLYNRGTFNKLNEYKCERIWYIVVFKANSPRFSAVFGETNKTIKCPFSAPFGYPEVLKKDTCVGDYYKAYELASDFFKKNGIKSVEIYLTPSYYDDEVLTAWINVLLTNHFDVSWCDINYSFECLDELCDGYYKYIKHNAKKNLHKSYEFEYKFHKCKDENEEHIAYEIIKKNREDRHHPLNMTEIELRTTVPYVKGEWFLVECDGVNIASALVYPVSNGICQIIYWGNLIEYAYKRPINFLAYELIKYYKEKNVRILDVGISTENGIPNLGLCDFKESIGCVRSSKYKLTKGIER